MTHKRPALLNIGIYGSLAGAAVLLLVILGAVADIGSFKIDDVEVSGRDFLSRAGLMMGLFVLLLLAIAYAIATDKEWSRDLMVVFWLTVGGWALAQAISSMHAGNGFNLDFTWVVALAIAIWYLYFSRDAAPYFRLLQRSRTSDIGVLSSEDPSVVPPNESKGT
jgi:hypothetical protein